MIAELPDELNATYDISSREIADLIFTTLMEGAE